MGRAPTVKSLKQDLLLTESQAVQVRGLIKGTIDPLSTEQTAAWAKRCRRSPEHYALVLHAVDIALDTHGVEYLGPRDVMRPLEWYAYCNTGDPYNTTIIYSGRSAHFYIGNWGDIAERHSNW